MSVVSLNSIGSAVSVDSISSIGCVRSILRLENQHEAPPKYCHEQYYRDCRQQLRSVRATLLAAKETLYRV